MSEHGGAERRARAATVLAAAGLDPQAVGRGELPAAEGLAPVINAPGGPAVLEALGEVGDAGVAARLAGLAADLGSGPLKKALRRALHRLRERKVGVAIPPPATSFRLATAPEIDGLVSTVDGRGDRVVWFLRPLPTGEGTLLLTVHLNEPAGVTAVRLGEVTRRQIRQARKDLADGAGWQLVPADWRALDALCVEGHERRQTPTQDTDYLRVRPRLTTEPPLPPRELVSTHVTPPTGAEASALVARSDKLLDEPEFHVWRPTPAMLEPVLAEIAHARESPILLSPLQQQERLRVALAAATRALYPAAATARRLRGTAYVLAETGRAGAAAVALATADALAAAPEGGAEVPLLAALVQRSVGALMLTASQQEEKERGDALVLTPGEIRARSSSHPSRTRG